MPSTRRAPGRSGPLPPPTPATIALVSRTPTRSRTSRPFYSGERASEHRDDALAILEEAGDLARLISLQNNVGIEAYFDGRWDDALEWYRRSGESAARVGDVVNVARAQSNEAEILSDRGQFDEARALFEQALRVWRAADYRIGVAVATSNLGRVMARSGRFGRPTAYSRTPFASSSSSAPRPTSTRRESRLAECLVFEGHHREALVALTPLREPDLACSSRLRNGSPATRWCSRGRASKRRSRTSSGRSRPARAANAEYEVALTLRAIAETSGAEDGEGSEILRRLGIVSTPSVPLP